MIFAFILRSNILNFIVFTVHNLAIGTAHQKYFYHQVYKSMSYLYYNVTILHKMFASKLFWTKRSVLPHVNSNIYIYIYIYIYILIYIYIYIYNYIYIYIYIYIIYIYIYIYIYFTLLIIWIILWSQSCSYHCTEGNFQRNISNYPLNSKSFHNHRYLSFHLKIVCNQPTVKKPSLNKEDLSNYRPIANLSFISKLTEKIVNKCLLDHLTSNSLLNLFQSAYTKFYSTETTLFLLHDNLSNSISMQ